MRFYERKKIVQKAITFSLFMDITGTDAGGPRAGKPHTHLCRFYLFYQKEGSLMARSSRLESGFQDKLRASLKAMFPGCMIFKMEQIQGIPDLLVLYKDKWALLEVKRSANAIRQPNQEYYVDLLNKMSFSSFIYPENRDEVLKALSEKFNR